MLLKIKSTTYKLFLAILCKLDLFFFNSFRYQIRITSLNHPTLVCPHLQPVSQGSSVSPECQVTNYSWQITIDQFPITNCPLQIANYKLLIIDFKDLLSCHMHSFITGNEKYFSLDLSIVSYIDIFDFHFSRNIF